MAKQAPQRSQASAKKSAPAYRSDKKSGIFSNPDNHIMIFGRQNYIYFGIGLGLVILGMMAMSGGSMPDPNKWQPEIIYSFRRITLAPMLMVAGFVVVILGIFKKANTADNPNA